MWGGDRQWGVASLGGKVSVTSPSRGCFPQARDLVQLLLLQQRDGGVQPEDSKKTLHAFLDLQGALPPVINIVFNFGVEASSHVMHE